MPTRRLVIFATLLLGLPYLLLLAGCGRGAPDQLYLMISVDTLRADHLGVYGGELGLTPRLDALAGESLVFTRAFAPSPFTMPSVSSLLTGRYPEENGIGSNQSFLRQGTPTLASELGGLGFATGAVVSNWVLRFSSGLSAGFDVYDDTLPRSEAVRVLPERTGTATTEAALVTLDALLERKTPRVFLWVHYQDPHGPYTPPGNLRGQYLKHERDAPGGRRKLPVSPRNEAPGAIPAYQAIQGQREVAWYRAGYDGEVRHVDAEIGRLLDGVAERGLLESAVVLFTADHGESLGERNHWFAHGEYLTDPLVRVPLMLRVPGHGPERREDVTSLVDLFPTVLALAGAPAGRDGLRGRDLLAPGAAQTAGIAYLTTLREARQPKRGLVADGYKLVTSEADTPQLFRLDDEATNLADREPERLAELGERLSSLGQALGSRPGGHERSLSEADRERLRALGYLDDED